MKFIRQHLPSPAMILASVSLLVGLSGVSYAAGAIPNHSVGTAQLKNKAVTRAKLRNNAVTGAKVANGTLMAADFKAGQLPAGPQGPKGDPGVQGPKGDKGDAGATHVTRRSTTGAAKGPGEYSEALATCQPGETLVGGGADVNDLGSAKPTLVLSAPVANSASTWHATARNDGAAGTVAVVAYALCAS